MKTRAKRRVLSTLGAAITLTLCQPMLPHTASHAQALPDSAETRKRLVSEITSFQAQWRRLWQQSIIDRNGGYTNVHRDTLDEKFGNYTPQVLRMYALTCYAEYAPFRQIYRRRASGLALRNVLPTSVPRGSGTQLNLMLPARISARGNELSVCPRWIPEEIGITVDEGERLDLALGEAAREQAYRLRRSLLSLLDMAAQKYPGDGWISGQRVRFLLDNHEFEKALQAARSCAGDLGWCASLEGLVHAQAGNAADAEVTFHRSIALRVAQRRDACADTTFRPLYPTSVRLSQRNTSCSEWDSIAERTWWLSDPLWSAPGNPRFVEHYARRTLLTLRTVTEEDERYIWRASAAGDALQEVIMRFGWPTHTWWGGYEVDDYIAEWTGVRLRTQAEYPYTVKEYAPDHLTLIPDFAAIANPFDALDEHWQWTLPDRAVRERWFPPEHMRPPLQLRRLPPGQSVVLRRDSALRYGLVIDDPVKELDAGDTTSLRAHLISSRSPNDQLTLADTLVLFGASLRVSTALRAEPAVISVEIPNRNRNEPAHRRRFGLRPPPSLAQMRESDVAISDPAFVLLSSFGAPPILDPDSAIARLTGSLQLPRNVPLALYWESYGFAVGDTIDVQLRILRNDGSALRSVGAFFGVVDAQRDSVSIRWREPDRGRNARELAAIKPTVARGIAVDIRNLEPGRYVFTVQMTRPDGTSARGERRVEVVR